VKLLVYVRDRDLPPGGWGRAWTEGFGCWCAPVPLNWVIGWSHSLWWRLAGGPHTAIDRAYAKGMADANREHARRAMERMK
jgi:hypothetical protein